MRAKAVIALILLPSFCFAEDSVPARLLPPLPELKLEVIPSGEDKIVAVSKGELAPFTGQLYSTDTAIRWLNYLDQYKTKTPLLLDTYRQVCEAEIRYRDDASSARQKAYEDVRNDLTLRLKEMERVNAQLHEELRKDPSFFKSRSFGIVVGVVSTMVLTSISIWAIKASQGN